MAKNNAAPSVKASPTPVGAVALITDCVSLKTSEPFGESSSILIGKDPDESDRRLKRWVVIPGSSTKVVVSPSSKSSTVIFSLIILSSTRKAVLDRFWKLKGTAALRDVI